MEQINLNNYIKEQNLCSKLQTGIRLNGQLSSVLFFLDEFVSDCAIEFVRLKGSDSSIILNEKEYSINELTKININSNIIKVTRPANAKGHIIISKIFVNQDFGKDPIKTNVVNCLTSSDKVKGVRKTDYGIFASEGAEISDESGIKFVETDPPNSWVRQGEKIVFVHPCKLLGIWLVNNPVIETDKKDTDKKETDKKETDKTPPIDKFKFSIFNKLHFDDIDSELWFQRIRDAGYLKQLKSNTSFISIDKKPIYDRVFVSEFSTNSNLDNLKSTKTILTPSLINYILLKKKFPKKNIKICGRLLPIVEFTNSEKSNQVLLFNKDIDTTKKIVDEWDGSIGKLVVVGCDIDKPGVNSIKENLSLKEVVSLFASSSLILDIGICNNYISSILELAMGTNSIVFTNNSKYIMCDNVFFINKECNIIQEIKKLKNKIIDFKIKETYQKIFTNNLEMVFND
jgi:hypothetical protein